LRLVEANLRTRLIVLNGRRGVRSSRRSVGTSVWVIQRVVLSWCRWLLGVTKRRIIARIVCALAGLFNRRIGDVLTIVNIRTTIVCGILMPIEGRAAMGNMKLTLLSQLCKSVVTFTLSGMALFSQARYSDVSVLEPLELILVVLFDELVFAVAVV
jgi:hypothetical protein